MHRPLAHRNSSFSHVGTVGDVSVCETPQLAKAEATRVPTAIYMTPQLTTVQFIRVVAAVIDAVTPLRHLQTYTIVLAAENSAGRTLELS